MRSFHWAETVGRLLVIELAAGKEGRLYNVRMKSARQRFLDYVEKHPEDDEARTTECAGILSQHEAGNTEQAEAITAE